MENSFFDKDNCLRYENRYSIKKEYVYDKKISLNDILEKVAVNDYKVLIQNVNEMKFGYYRNKHFIFNDGSDVVPKYLIQMRLFNEVEEILVLSNKEEYYLRVIKDEMNGESKLIETVDSISVLFGKLDKDENLLDGFVELYDAGRKIRKAGQAGYGYYRYVDIKPEK